MLFEIKDLKKAYGERTVLDIPDLHFEEGIIYALLGPNGSGKTTLLEILSLLMPPTAGRIRYRNKEVDFTGNNLAALRREIVMVQQNPVLFTTTVYKNLEFGLQIRGISKTERARIIEESLDLVGMRQFIGAEAHRLSGGETQRTDPPRRQPAGLHRALEPLEWNVARRCRVFDGDRGHVEDRRRHHHGRRGHHHDPTPYRLRRFCR